MLILDSWPIYFLTQQPFLILLIAMLVATMAYIVRSHLRSALFFILSALIWFGYLAWELYMLSWRSPTGDVAIRVDALFLEPPMQVLLAINLILVIRYFFVKKRRALIK